MQTWNREIIGLIVGGVIAVVALVVLDTEAAVGLVLALAGYLSGRNTISGVERRRERERADSPVWVTLVVCAIGWLLAGCGGGSQGPIATFAGLELDGDVCVSGNYEIGPATGAVGDWHAGGDGEVVIKIDSLIGPMSLGLRTAAGTAADGSTAEVEVCFESGVYKECWLLVDSSGPSEAPLPQPTKGYE